MKSDRDLEGLRLHTVQARKEDLCDCLAAVILATSEVNEKEAACVAALKDKYNALRTVMLRHCVQLQLGSEYNRFDSFFVFNFGEFVDRNKQFSFRDFQVRQLEVTSCHVIGYFMLLFLQDR